MSWILLLAVFCLAVAALLVIFRGASTGKPGVALVSRAYVAGGIVLLGIALLQAGIGGGPERLGLTAVVSNAAYYPSLLTLGGLAILLGVFHRQDRKAWWWIGLPFLYLVGTALVAQPFWEGSSSSAAIGALLIVPAVLAGFLPEIKGRQEP
jgi:hypothetical protein